MTKEDYIIINISGRGGSGVTSLCKALSHELGIPYFNDSFRDIAKECGFKNWEDMQGVDTFYQALEGRYLNRIDNSIENKESLIVGSRITIFDPYFNKYHGMDNYFRFWLGKIEIDDDIELREIRNQKKNDKKSLRERDIENEIMYKKLFDVDIPIQLKQDKGIILLDNRKSIEQLVKEIKKDIRL